MISKPVSLRFKQKLGIKALPVRMDSQAKYAAVSRGDAEIYLRFTLNGYRECIWDHAAGSIITTGTVQTTLLFNTEGYWLSNAHYKESGYSYLPSTV